MHFDTLSIHAGHIEDNTGSIMPPIYLTSTFERDAEGNIGGKGFIYSRTDNPNRKALEIKLALLEGGREAFAFPSGMAAALAIMHSVLEPDAHVIIPDDCYHGVAHLIKKTLPRWRVSFTEVDMTDASRIKAAIQKNTRLIIVETPSNPQLKITDIAAITAIAKPLGIPVACDNTWTTPVIQRPFELGADIVFHSSTKFFGGHSDIIAGCVILKENDEVALRMRDYQVTGGVVPSPFDCWLLNRSISTLSIRLERQCRNAVSIAAFLKDHPKVEKVYFPGLPSHPNHEIAKAQMHGSFGSMISILLKADEGKTLRFASSLELFKHATSLGGVESLIEQRRSAEGIMAKSPENLLRLSVGIEFIDDLIADLEKGLDGLSVF